MSTHTYGYGVNTDCITNTTIEKIKSLIAMAPNVLACCEPDYADAEAEGTSTPFEFAEYLAEGWDGREEAGLATILAAVITECEGIYVEGTTDGYNTYLILAEKLPWEYNEKEKALTDETLNAIFRKYISVLTDKELVICRRDVEYD